jgi:mono/diheme cytochrome c family protein
MINQNCKVFFRKTLKCIVFFYFSAIQMSFAQDVELGENLFSNNCASCHYYGPRGKKLVGPGLGDHTLDKYSQEWLYSWIRNSAEFIASGDEQAVAVYEEYNKAAMSAFTYLTDDDLDNILAYLEVGPAEAEEVALQPLQENSSKSNSPTILIILLIALVLFAFVLGRMKNVLKEINGETTHSLFQSAYLWLRRTPIIIGLVIFYLVLSSIGAAWDQLLAVGVQQGYQPEQPIAFSHKIHAGENAVDCNYCHSGARHSKSAGVPSANVCMNCHTYINEGSSDEGTQEISKIYAAIGFDPESRTYIEGYEQQPIEWVRIHNLPDLAYFNHSQHVSVAGVECQECHGPIQEMEVVEQYSPLTMGWCINCHRETKVDTTNNYYHDLNENWVEKYHGDEITAEKIGGLECGKCHY